MQLYKGMQQVQWGHMLNTGRRMKIVINIADMIIIRTFEIFLENMTLILGEHHVRVGRPSLLAEGNA